MRKLTYGSFLKHFSVVLGTFHLLLAIQLLPLFGLWGELFVDGSIKAAVGEYPMIFAWLVFVVLGLAFISSLFFNSRKMETISASDKLAMDTRPPILFLRSFSADEILEASASDSSKTIHSFPLMMMEQFRAYFGRTQEESISDLFNHVGPLVAIGKPGEGLPTLGAARTYVGDDAWQEQVQTWMEKAQLVVLLIGKTGGFWWEVKQALTSVSPTKILFLLPRDPEIWRLFRAQTEGIFPVPLPDWTPPIGNYTFYIGGVLAFDEHWNPQIFTAPSPEQGFSFSMGLESVDFSLNLFHILSPVLKRSGFLPPLDRVPTREKRLAGLFIDGFCLMAILAVGTIGMPFEEIRPLILIPLSFLLFFMPQNPAAKKVDIPYEDLMNLSGHAFIICVLVFLVIGLPTSPGKILVGLRLEHVTGLPLGLRELLLRLVGKFFLVGFLGTGIALLMLLGSVVPQSFGLVGGILGTLLALLWWMKTFDPGRMFHDRFSGTVVTGGTGLFNLFIDPSPSDSDREEGKNTL